jgi:uncharacterized glyoxalase superfamily protein PhnB
MAGETIHPVLMYRDPSNAVQFLAFAFGFKKVTEERDEEGKVIHAELRLGDGVIMIGKAEEALMSPLDLPGASVSLYVYVEDPDDHCELAKEAGANVIQEPESTEYGSREYTTMDLEGHIWTFGTYRPGAG